MKPYQHILAAVDLSADATAVVERAVALARAFGATLSLVHVIEPLNYAYGGDLPVDFSAIQEEIRKQAEHKLAALAQKAGVPADRCFLPTGRPATEIHDLCAEHRIDAVVIGSHGRQGLALLLGSTANALLHGTRTDVLAVRIGAH